MNSVILIGRLSNEPKLMYTQSQMAVCKFNIAIDRKKGADEENTITDFPRVTVFGKQAENCERYLSKGLNVAIQGRIQTGSYKDKDTGKTIYTTDVVADRVEYLEFKSNAVNGNMTPPREEVVEPVNDQIEMPDFQVLNDNVPW